MADSTRWESFGGLTTLRREMDRLFERVLGREASSPLGEVEPAIEVAETPEAVIVKAQVPGVSKEHLQVNVTDTTLTSKAKCRRIRPQKRRITTNGNSTMGRSPGPSHSRRPSRRSTPRPNSRTASWR